MELAQQIPVLDITLSLSGKNTHTLGCEITGQQRHYCVCLHHHKQYERGLLGEAHNDCRSAYANNVCPALKMRQEELNKGESIYFSERLFKNQSVKVDRTSNSYLKGRFGDGTLKPKPKATRKAITPQKKTPSINELNHAALVTRLAIIDSTAVETIKPKPGESVREFAIRKRAALAAKS